jgi:hypothetical protein
MPQQIEVNPHCLIRQAWKLRYGLSKRVAQYLMSDALMCQLSHCKSDAARRLTLGLPNLPDPK